MKTKISRIGKKSLSIVIALIMIVSTMLVGMVSVNAASETFVAKSKIYIDIGSTWYSSVTDTNVNATIYAKYCYSDINNDINNPVSTEKLTQVSESIYTGTIPDNAFIRCIKVERRNSDGTTTWNSFNALGSKRSDDGNNLATFTKTDADWSVGTVTWSTYSGGSTSHSISKGAETNGTFSVSATSATAGSTVTVTTFPVTGYEVDKVTYTANGSTQNASGSNNTYTFTMPAANVTVNVTFKQSTTPSATYAPFTPATPTIKAFKADGKTEIAEEFTGTDFIIKVTSNIESGVKYRLYEGSSSEYLENADGVFTLNVTEAGEKTYTVKAVCGNLESQASAPVTITIITAVDISGVRLTTSKTEVSVNETFTLTAEVAPVGLSGVTYTYYMNNAPINGATDITSNTYQVRIASAGSATFKVAATANGKTVPSSSVTVTATKVDNVHNLKVYFKCPSAPAYKPSVSIDGKAPVAMTQGTELGKNYSGTLTFYWYYADLGQINSADAHTLTFTTARTRLNATMEDNFVYNEYYLAVDNLMSGTEVVDLTEFSGDAEKEHILNFYHSATNTVYSGVGTDKTLGFTNIGGTRYKMGTLVDNNGVATFSIRSATTMQMLSAQLTTVSKTQQALLDVNLDGRVDVKDATLMQRALVS